jgi:hypothetical protein
MPVRIHKSRHDDHVGGVNQLGVGGGQVWPDGGDLCAFNQYVGFAMIAYLGVEAEDAAILQ